MKRSARGALVLLFAAAAASAAPPVPTVKDVGRATIRPGEPVQPDPERARQLYRELLEEKSTDPQLQTEALRRLGDTAMERGDALRGETPGPGAGTEETRAAIALYTRLLQQEPDYPRADVVHYQLARAWEAEGDPDRALVHLDRLVGGFPGSVHFVEAQFRRGELLFSAQRWRESEAAYAAVIAAGPRTEFNRQALYKHGWTLFKQSAPEESARSFLALLDGLLKDPASSNAALPLASLSRADRELAEDAFRALSIQFGGLEGGATLDSALAVHGDTPYAWMLYASLGDLLVEKERYTDAADAYRRFVRRDPTHPHAPDLQGRATDAYLKGGFSDLAFEAKREFVRLYAFDQPFWQRNDRADAPQVVARLRDDMKDVSAYLHATAQSSGAAGDYAAAAAAYRQYMRSFPDDDGMAATHYLLADVLYESGQFSDAAREFEHTAYEYAPHARSAEAGYASLVAYEKRESELTGEDKTAWHLAAVDAALRFAGTFPSHPEAGAVRLRAAQQLFNAGQFERAGTVAREVTAGGLAPVQQRTAWNVAADASFETGEFAAAEQAYLEVLKALPADSRERGEIANRLAATVYKQGEARQAAGDIDGAVTDFLRIGALAPDSPIRATAEHDAAALLIREKQWIRAIPVLEAFRRDHPGHALAGTVPGSLALAYSESGQPLLAAAEFERIAEAGGEPEEVTRAALVEAAGLYEQGGDRRRATATWERFLERHPEPLDEANGVRLKLADLARDTDDAAGRQRWLQALVAADTEAGPGRTESSRLLAARASLELAAPARARFESVKLKAPLSRSLKAKRSALESALQAYQKAADYGVAEVTTAATFATAELYRRLATDLMASERPRNLDADELEQYDLLLEEQAYPFEERAIELHESNVARVRGGVYDDGVQGSYASLAALKPARYAREETLDLLPPGMPAGPDATGANWRPLVEAGTISAAAGDWPAAEARFGEALAAGAGAPAMTGMALAYRQGGRFAMAEQAYRAALLAEPGFAPALRNLGVLLDLYLQRPAEALQCYREYQATQAAPDDRVAAWVSEVEIRTSREAAGSGGGI